MKKYSKAAKLFLIAYATLLVAVAAAMYVTVTG